MNYYVTEMLFLMYSLIISYSRLLFLQRKELLF